MPTITDGLAGEIEDPTLRAILTRTVREFELAAEKVAANHAEPAAFPLPKEADSTEQILAARFRSLPAERRVDAAKNAVRRISLANGARQRRFGDLSAVDLGTATPIEVQVGRMPTPAHLVLSEPVFTSMLRGADVDADAGSGEAGAAAVAAPTTTKLELRVHKVVCRDETGISFPIIGTPGSDEIYLAGTSIDETGDAAQVSAFKVGDFDSGDVKKYAPPRRFTWFSLKEGSAFPKGYFVLLVLTEKDQGDLPGFVSKLLAKVKARVHEELRKAAVEAGKSGDVVTALVALGADWVLDKVWDLIGRIWGDDVFPPVMVRVRIPSLNARWPGGKADSPEKAVVFKGHDGKYELVYDWRLFA